MAMLYSDSGLAIDPATQSCELEACLELGRLDGSVAMCPPTVRQLLALRSLFRRWPVKATSSPNIAFMPGLLDLRP